MSKGISYELAKKLKDAGFQQNWENNYEVISDYKSCDNPNCLKGHKTLYCHSAHLPTLSELIEACGEYITLTHNGINWRAWKGIESDCD